MSIRVLHLSVVLAVSLCASPAWSTFISFDNEADWLNAVGTIIATEDFTGFASDITLSTVGVPLAGGMVTSMFNPISAENFIDATNDRVAARVSGPDQLGAYVRVDFSSPVPAWSADLTSLGPTTAVSVYDADDNLLGQSVLGGPDFRGFQLNDGDLASYLTIARTDALSDAIHINAMSIVPEPSTASLLALGLVGIAATRRRAVE